MSARGSLGAIGPALAALALIASPAAAGSTPEQGEAELLDLINANAPRKVSLHPTLELLADFQARSNARRQEGGELDDWGRDFRARCRAAGLIGREGAATLHADEFYFRTLHAYGGSLSFDPMIAEIRARKYEHVGIRCVEGIDGRFYWCITLFRIEPAAELAGAPGADTRSVSGLFCQESRT